MSKHIHFIGIGGTAMAALARAFKAAGFKVTGSEAHKIFPPMSDYLEKNKIKYYFPFNPHKIGQPNEIVVGNAHYSPDNPEVKYAQENKIEFEHFPRLVEKYLIQKNSVVVAGTYGKTTTTSMSAWLLDQANKKPNYLVGGIPLNFRHGARLARAQKSQRKNAWSVVEGDEYPAASPWDFSPKFAYYHAKYLILTAAEWDHMDIYKTQKSYLDVFKKLVQAVPRDGLIVAKLGGENLEEVLKVARCRVVYYSKSNPAAAGELIKHKKKNIYFIDQVEVKKHVIKFKLAKGNRKIGGFETSLIGDFNLENWSAALALAHELRLPLNKVQAAVKSFKGVKRRLEIRAIKNKVAVIDDFAHSPAKAKESIKALKKYFSESKIFIIFEPNRGGRSKKCLKKYQNIFDGVAKVFIPKLTKYKPKPGVSDVSGRELARYVNGVYQIDNKKIINSLLKQIEPGDVIAFLGSRNFSGMIEEVISQL